MGTVSQKLTYTAKAIDDIQKALEEKGFDMSGVELMRYGDFIRKITGQGGGGESSEPTAPSFINKIESASFILCTTKKVNNVSMINVLYSKLPCTTKKVNIKYLYNSKLPCITKKVNNVSITKKVNIKYLSSKLLNVTRQVNNVSTVNVLYNKLPCTTKKVNGINGSSASDNLENTIKLERTLNRCFINYKGNNTTLNIKVLTRKPEQVNNNTILNAKVSFYNQKQIKQIEMEDTN